MSAPLALTSEEVADLVGDWVEGVVGVTTIDAWPNADAPAEPYVVVMRTISDRVMAPPAGQDFVEQGGKIIQVPLAETYYRFTIDAFGEDAESYLRRIVAAADVPTAMWPLRPLILFETSRIVTETEIRDQIFQGRAHMTIEARGIPRLGFPINVIESQSPEFEPVD